ncbi:hypothetical protein HYV31_02985 [candidate division WWE3 bacterium]|nr:hypothetical protein [candidate division WWE3 bacterium]
MKFVIVAGGQGTKLWPLSTESAPKHFQEVIFGKSSFAWNVETLLSAYPAEDIFINTKRMYLPLAIQQAPQIPLKNFIIEPDIKMGRGPSDGLVFAYMSAKFPDEPMITIQADNFRKPEEDYLKMLAEMDTLIRRDKRFITGGKKASYPTLGVDYLQLGEKVSIEGSLEFYKVNRFVYRSDSYKETKRLAENYHVVIHVNHFAWYPDMFLAEYRKYKPNWYNSLMQIKEVLDDEAKVTEIYSAMEKGATEEVLSHTMEESYAVLVPFEWIDFGAWNSVYELISENDEVVKSENVIALDSSKSLVKCTDPNKLIALYGVENLAIVDTGKCLLIMPLDKSEKIKDIIEEVKNQNFGTYL